MIKTITKSLVLTAAIAALGAIAIPSMATAANWSPLNTVHTLTSPSNITFTITGSVSTLTISCSSGPTFTSQVRTTASPLMDLTTTTNLSCTASGGQFGQYNGCNANLAMIGLPLWNVDGTSGTSNVKINSVNIQGTLAGATCAPAGSTFTITGTLTGGVWSNLTRSLAFNNDTGLTWTSSGGPYPVTVTASEFIKDTTSPFVSLM